MNLVLIGYRGAGKSTVGRLLAERLKREFVDVDDRIERREGRSIREMVETKGWEYFRQVEKKAIEEIVAGDSLVIAPGGGAVLDPENVKCLQRGLVVWLKADPDVLAARIGREAGEVHRRPTLTGKGVLEEIREVLSARNPLYSQAAHLLIETSALTPDAVVDKIRKTLSALRVFPDEPVRPGLASRIVAGSAKR